MAIPSGYTSAQVVQAVPTGINSALVLISATSFSGVSSVSLATNSFTSTYRNYKVIFQAATTSSNILTLRTRTSGTDNTDINYFQASAGTTSAAATNDIGENSTNTITVLNLSTVGARDLVMVFDVISPLQAATTGVAFMGTVTGIIGGTGRVGRSFVGAYRGGSVAVDSLSFISSIASDLTGFVRLYGYTES